MRVPVEISDVELENDSGLLIPSVQAVCQRCYHETESYGTDEPSIKRCLALMREECPENENNWYFDDNE
jgi:hypothetical protein